MNMMSTLKSWRSYRKIIFELNALSQRELDDIGIARNQIREFARKAVR